MKFKESMVADPMEHVEGYGVPRFWWEVGNPGIASKARAFLSSFLSTRVTLPRTLALMFAVASFMNASWCQGEFHAIPPEKESLYHLNFERNFFPSPEAEKTDRELYAALLKRLEQLKGKVADSPQNMIQALELYDSSLVAFMRHTTYRYLRFAVNTADRTSLQESDDFDEEFSSRTAFVQQELMTLDSERVNDFREQVPALGRYRFFVSSAQRYRQHTLPLPAEEALAATSQLATGWQFDLYESLMEKTNFGTLGSGDSIFDVRRDRALIASNADRSARREGWERLYAGYSSQRELYAFALLALVKARNIQARLRGFENAPGEVYFDSYWTEPEVTALLDTIARYSSLYKRYEILRADHVKKQFGYPTANIWDISYRPDSVNAFRWTISQATDIIHDALAPLGGEYVREVAALLDPRNGRMDIVPGPFRKSGGFSKGFPGVTTVFFSGGYSGSYNDVRVLMHELGHAVHRQMMKSHDVLPVYANGPHYLFESFSIFNELLLADYLYQHASTASMKEFFLEQFLDGKGMEMFVVGQEAELEQAIYRGELQGSVHAADDLDSLARAICGRYSIWPGKHEQLAMKWITSRLFYEDPLYDINYVFGAMLGLKYYALFLEHPREFVPHYVALLTNGFTAPPEDLLRHFLGINLREPHLLRDVMRIFDGNVNQLQKLYSK